MIVISGAAGKTGRALLRTLRERGHPARALVRNAEQADAVMSLGVQDTTIGDLEQPSAWQSALKDARALYLICPNMHPDEVSIVSIALHAAKQAGVERVVYHSVLHPQVEAMPHHWAKMRVEELIFASGVPFTILQPCAYMQNLLGYWESITREGIYPLPYSLEARISLVELGDVAEAAACALTEAGHLGAIYELAGAQALNQHEVAQELTRVLGRSVQAREVDRDAWRQNAERSGLHGYTLETLLKMFAYYDAHGLVGNPRVLGWLLGRKPKNLGEALSSMMME